MNELDKDEQVLNPIIDTDMEHQNNVDINPTAVQDPQTAGEITAPMAMPNGTLAGDDAQAPLAAANPQPPKEEDPPALPAEHQPHPSSNPVHAAHNSEYASDPSLVSPFAMAPPPGGLNSNFSKPVQVAGQISQPRNGSLDSQGSASRRHHLLRHTLPPECVGEHAVHQFGVTTVPDALRAVQKMSQRDLQQAFERVYNVKSSSNNNNWLRKKLVEGKKIKKIEIFSVCVCELPAKEKELKLNLQGQS
jgi:hypothetical protein